MRHEQAATVLVAQAVLTWLKRERTFLELRCQEQDRDAVVAQWMRGLDPEREAKRFLAWLEEVDEADEPKRKEGVK
jgi:hypothetical protein